MTSVISTIGISGVEGYLIEVEVKLLSGMATMNIVGLGDLAVKEAKDRIESAFDQLGVTFPKKKIIVNLSPSDIKKSGTYFDLSMVIGILLASEQLTPVDVKLEEIVFLGEIGLMGDLKNFVGVLPMIIAAKNKGFKKIVLPKSSLLEASMVKGIELFGFGTVEEVIKWLEKRQYYQEPKLQSPTVTPTHLLDFDEVIGHEHVLKYVLAAAAGGHNMLMIGPPGCGKSMIAKRFESILPEMTEEEMLEVVALHSVAGLLKNHTFPRTRPFRAPHYNTSANAIIGGGTNALPGEISLAHNGVLFLDELPEFNRQTLESLRQPLEDRVVTIARVKQTNTFPANFILIAAMNPCPCGYNGTGKCQCSNYEIRRYRQRISGPIMDRMDIQKFLGKVDFFNERTSDKKMSSSQLKESVLRARNIQNKRFKTIPEIRQNAQMEAGHVKEFCQLDSESKAILQQAYEKFRFTARTCNKILKISRTFADLGDSVSIRKEDLVAALMGRDLDKENSTMYVQVPK